mmetsp:Transcript_24524/g.78846  ORF Transcript_24524/g.78846 Transcript_24524/m.78846 type:complete len:90 (-) Transcript_24524:73-342(-)
MRFVSVPRFATRVPQVCCDAVRRQPLTVLLPRVCWRESGETMHWPDASVSAEMEKARPMVIDRRTDERQASSWTAVHLCPHLACIDPRH